MATFGIQTRLRLLVAVLTLSVFPLASYAQGCRFQSAAPGEPARCTSVSSTGRCSPVDSGTGSTGTCQVLGAEECICRGSFTPHPTPTPALKPTPSPTPIVVLPPPPPGSLPPPVAVLTQRYNNKRTGANLQEHVLTVRTVGSSEFQKLYTIPVAGQVYAQPLLVPEVKWTDGRAKNILIVATMTNMVEAFQVDDAIHGPAFPPIHLWSTPLGQPVTANFMSMASSRPVHCDTYDTHPIAMKECFIGDTTPPPVPLPLPPLGATATPLNGLGLYNINPWIGIVSTPVIDLASQTIYVVCKLVGPNGVIFNRLFALDLVTGRRLREVAIGVPPEDTIAEVPATSYDSHRGVLAFSPRMHMNRPGLLLQNGRIYIAFGSHQDTPPWHGWIFSYDAQTFKRVAVWCSTPNGMAGGIWQAGSGIAGADDGSIYVMTGNGEGIGSFGSHFVQLDSNLKVLGSYAPPNAKEMDEHDIDLGSSGPVLFPEPGNSNILFGGGKDSRLFVLDMNTHLGMRQYFQAGLPPEGIDFGDVMARHHIHGSPVLWRSSQNGMNLYVWPERDFLRKFHWNDRAAVLDCKNKSGAEEKCQDGDSPTQQSTIPAPGLCLPAPDVVFCPWSMPGGILSLSAEGNTLGTGIVWASMPKDADALYNVVPGELHALDADDITHELWNSEKNRSRDGNFLFAKYNPPVVANGRVYMATFSNAVNVYGLRQWAKFLDYKIAPPGAVAAGHGFSVQATFVNVGTTVWKKGTLQLIATDEVKIWGADRSDLPNDVNPGDQVIVTLNLIAPTNLPRGAACSVAGTRVTCNFRWVMMQNLEAYEATPVARIEVVGATPPPAPWPACPVGEKCCETDPTGAKCTRCVSNAQSCR